MLDMIKRHSALALLLVAAGTSVGCAGEDATTGDEDDLTSTTARERGLSIEGYVYVKATASDSQILAAVRKQNKSGFGALREADISANNRELSEIDAKSFAKEPVTIVDPKNPSAPGTPALRVRYKYTDCALVPISMARRSAFNMALLQGNYDLQTKRILTECTGNTAHDKEFESAIWYVFNPSLPQCKEAISKEQQTIDDARKGLTDPGKQIVAEEMNRLYLPVTARLEATSTSTKKTYPEYDRLWSGGVQPGKVVISIVGGVMADWAAGETPSILEDMGYTAFFEQMREITKARPNLELVSAEGVDLTTFTVGTKTVKGATWADLSSWELGKTGYPSNITSSADRLALRKAVADKIYKHWLRFEAPFSVKIGKDAAKDVTVVINTYYGAETDETPHRRAINTSDVVIYNGHSYIGSGPLDPIRYDSSDFPGTYQLFFFNSCVSFNYYEKDFFKMKPGGEDNLDMVTNGLESWLSGSGAAMGKFVGALLNGKQISYKDILDATAKGAPGYDVGQDPLRVVDGELGNKYKPSTTPIVVTAK
ncbi:MAG: hypothetical protein QM820_13880 [Minicystis sp.]